MRLFISYAHADVARVKELVDLFRTGGHDPWFNHKLLPGQDWQAELLAAITASDAFVYALTPESVASEWCQWEFARAVELGKPVIPVLVRRTKDIPKEISRFQYADVSDGYTPFNIAQVMGGLTHIAAFRVQSVPAAPANPADTPAQAVGTTHASSAQILIPPDLSHILPSPFEWCKIPAGEVTIEYGAASVISNLKPSRLETVVVPTFYIAKYPVTVDQFQVFVDDPGGYNRHTHWHFQDTKKRFRKFNNPKPVMNTEGSCPRTHVSWYESVAFANWLTFSLQLGKESIISLPSEQEWQRAGQGNDNRMYPWGNEYNPKKFNLLEHSKQVLRPVNSYPEGVSPFGVMDMVGNGSEWTRTPYGLNIINLVIRLVAPDMVHRGGAFSFHNLADMRLTARNSAEANVQSSSRGFRIVFRSLPFE